MSSVYFDTSSFLKLIVQEPGSTTATQAWMAADVIVASRLLWVEARAGLAMARRMRRLSAAAHVQAKSDLQALCQDAHLVEATPEVIDTACDLAEGESLRGYDAVHLSSALRAAVDVLVSADGDLLRAALSRGCSVIDTRS